MAYPTQYDLTYSYNGFAQGLGDGSFPGSQMDADMAGLSDSIAAINTFLAASFRSDGVLNVAAIPTNVDLMDYAARAELAAANAVISETNAAASALAASGYATSALLKANNLSDLVSASTARGNLGLGSLATLSAVGTAQLTDANVTTAKIADANVTTAKIADGNVTTAKIAANAVDYSKLALGTVIGRAYASSGAVATTTTTIPNDDTIPQITEGAEFLTVTITPKTAISILRVTAEITCSPSVSSNMIAAIFRDATAGALGCAFALGSGGSEVRRIVVTVEAVSGSTSATTFRLRAGMGSAGTLTINGSGGSRLLGGGALTTLTVTEFNA